MSQTVPVAEAPASEEASSSPGPSFFITLKLLLASLVSAALLFCSFFPVALGWLAWFALVPMLFLIRADISGIKRTLVALLTGLVFFFAAISWMRVAHPAMQIAWVALSIYCALYVPLLIGLVRRIERSTTLPLALILPTVCIALDYLRSTQPAGGFSWYQMGYSQQGFLTFIQIADLGGVYLVSFLVVAVNAVLFEWVYRSEMVRSWLGGKFSQPPISGKRAILTSLILLMVFGLSLGYGSWRMTSASFTEGPELALNQGDLSQEVRNARTAEDGSAIDAIQTMRQHYLGICDLANTRKVDMIIWPETSWPKQFELSENECRLEHPWLQNQLEKSGTPQLIGLNATEPGGKPRYNSALLLSPQGKMLHRYDKIHRVPFGEYVPLKNTLPIVRSFVPYEHEYEVAEGQSLTRFPVGKHHFGVVICYEDTVPHLARKYVTGEDRKVDFFVNISNDGWFKGTQEHEEHFAICRFRAIETRRSVVRVVNMGISGVIDGNGRPLRPIEKEVTKKGTIWEIPADAEELPVSEWKKFKKVPGVIFTKVPIDSRGSFYVWAGDWPVVLCFVGTLGMLLTPIVRRNKTETPTTIS